MNFTYKQPYVTWKGPSTGSAVPTWSRPLINNNTNTNTGTSFAARPIKHWRKQLTNTGSGGRAGVGMPMDRPGGAVYLGSAGYLDSVGYLGTAADCSNCQVNLTELFPTTKNTVFDTTKDPSGNCVACNPETNIIKSGITLLKKDYYSDTKAYLQSRCQTYEQKLSTTQIPGNNYINSITHQPIPPSDSPTGSQVYYTENCTKKCATENSVVRTIYKPNSQQYSQQGSVSSSSRLTRLKNNTITKNGNTFKTAWGQQGANAGRYQGSSDSTYFLKTKIQECVPQHRNGNKTTSCNIPNIVEVNENNYKYFAYVVNYGSNTVSVYTINPSTGALSQPPTNYATGDSPSSVSVDPTGKFAYVANSGSIGPVGISAYTINPATGALTGTTNYNFGISPNSVAVAKSGKFAYITNSAGAGTVSAYTINSSTGDLSLINTLTTGSSLPISVTVDPTGQFVYVANSGSTGIDGLGVSAYTIDPNTGALSLLNNYTTGITPNSVTVDPTGQFVYVANVGSNNGSSYTINQSTGALTGPTTYATGTAPRSVTVDPTGKFAYVTNSAGAGTVSAYTINPATGALTGPTNTNTVSNPWSVTVDPTGKFVYVANFGSTGVAGVSAYTINPATGALTGPTNYPSGSNPISVITVRILQ
jgi:6-phosphogluconolactonase (cycloisomerase 2 family)